MRFTATNSASFLCKIRVSELVTTMVQGYTAGGNTYAP